MRRLAGGLALAAALCVCGAARAQPAPPTSQATPVAGDDVAYLKKGGFVRGTLIDASPDRSVRMLLVTGEVMTIPWSEVDRLTPGVAHPAGPAATPLPSTAPPSAPVAPPAPAAPSPPVDVPPAAPPAAPVAPAAAVPASAPATILLHVVSPREVEIVGRPDDGAEWSPICQSPCDKAVRLDWEYEVRGEGVKHSAPFALQGAGGDTATLDVDPASLSAFIVGIIATAGGWNLALLGGIVIATGVAENGAPSGPSASSNQSLGGALLAVGGVVAAVGLTAGIAGIFATVNNASTHVEQDGAGAVRRSGIRLSTTPLRLARFGHEAVPYPAATDVPLVTLAF